MFKSITALALSVILFTLPGIATADAAADALWTKLAAGKHVVVIRHAQTEAGIGDPEGFDLADCKTQRNLSAAGREHAARIGAAFKARGIPVGEVLSSRWCRCVDTAQAAFGRVKTDRMLDSVFNDRTRSPEQKAREVRQRMQQPVTGGNLILVTHNFNISALAGVSTAPGEMVVMSIEPGGNLKTVGQLTVP